jgi:hypothetical protein
VLNAEEETAEHAKIVRLVEMCREVVALRKAAPLPYPPELTDEIFAYQTKIDGLLKLVNELLGDFRFTPALIGPDVAVVWRATRKPRATRGQIKRARGAMPVHPHSAVRILLEMTEMGTLDRVRQCPVCGRRWFFAQKNKRMFCSSNCRVEKHLAKQKTPAAKEDRKEYMKEYRKNPKVKSKKGEK